MRKSTIHAALCQTPAVSLTPRETDVLALLVQGLNYREIASTLHITGHTAREYIARLYLKLQVNRRSTCVAKALALNLIKDHPVGK
jgi:DNA-binding CsgD family transcriptional regulator